MRLITVLALVFCCSCSTTSYYIVRHGEKETNTMVSDVPLSAAGQQRALALRDRLNGKVDFVTSTNTLRTRSTGQPLAESMNRAVHVYAHTDTALLRKYRNEKNNILLVGHSNTVDDLVNFFMGRPVLTDLPDSAYGDLFIVRKKGKDFTFTRERFGK